MSGKMYRYQSIVGLLHDRGINIKFKKYDPRPETEFDDTNDLLSTFDCTTRAMCTVFDVPYGEIFDKQLKYAKQFNSATSSNNITIEIAREYGYHLYQFKLPMNMLKFYLIRPKGRYIIEIENHLFAYIDGIIYDRTVDEYKSSYEIFDNKDNIIKNSNGIYEYNKDLIHDVYDTELDWSIYLFNTVVSIYHPKEEDDYWYPKEGIPEILS